MLNNARSAEIPSKTHPDNLTNDDYLLLIKKKSKKLSLGIIALLVVISTAFMLILFNILLRLNG